MGFEGHPFSDVMSRETTMERRRISSSAQWETKGSHSRNLCNISRIEKALKPMCDNPAHVEERGYPSLEKEETLRNV